MFQWITANGGKLKMKFYHRVIFHFLAKFFIRFRHQKNFFFIKKNKTEQPRTWIRHLSERDQLNGVCVFSCMFGLREKVRDKNPTSTDINRKICLFSLHWLMTPVDAYTSYTIHGCLLLCFALIHIYSELPEYAFFIFHTIIKWETFDNIV